MESITFTPTTKKIKWTGKEEKLTDKSYSLINHINFILELIIVNTLQFNKLTSADEIFERLVSVQNEPNKELEINIDTDIDIDTIENICQALCLNNGVLIKLIKNNMNYYKLNHKNYM